MYCWTCSDGIFLYFQPEGINNILDQKIRAMRLAITFNFRVPLLKDSMF